MNRKSKRAALPDWATEITSLRERLRINQAELARRMECSAMTISRWERGLLQPSAEHFVRLGNLGNKTEAWFFWESAGIQAAKMVEALNAAPRGKGLHVVGSKKARDDARAAHPQKMADVVGVPLLRAAVGSHGIAGDRRTSLRTIPASEVIGIPAAWCPHPAYTSLLRVKGHSMEPLIRNGDILAVDVFETERGQLEGKIVVAAHEESGLTVSRVRRYETLTVLEAENRQYDAVVLNKASRTRIVGKVLWWISAAP